MPSQINLRITGRIQNIVFYKRDNKYYGRSVSRNIRQTKATKKRASEFGTAARIGKILRQQLVSVIPFPADNKMQTRLVSCLFSWLRSGFDPAKPTDPVPLLNQFPFTEGYSIRVRWKVSLEITKIGDDAVQIKIPAFVPAKSIEAPAGTVSVKCNIAAAACNPKNGAPMGDFSTSLSYNYDDKEVPEQIVSIALPLTAATLFVTGVSLEYYFNKNGHLHKTTNKAFMPAGIVKAMYW